MPLKLVEKKMNFSSIFRFFQTREKSQESIPSRTLEGAFTLGYEDALARRQNPYAKTSPLWKAWTEGHADAKNDLAW